MGTSPIATPGGASSSCSRASRWRARHLTVAESERLLNASDPDFRPLVRAALETGCRYSELARMAVQDFNPGAKTVVIPKSKSGKVRRPATPSASCPPAASTRCSWRRCHPAS